MTDYSSLSNDELLAKIYPKMNLKSVQIGGKPATLQADIADAVSRADADMRAAGSKGINIASSFRTKEQQEAAYDRYQSGKGGLAAKPGMSRHEKGLAVDIGNWQEAEPYLKKYGLVNPFVSKKDPGHFQFPGFPGAYKPPTDISKARSMVADASGKVVPPQNEDLSKLSNEELTKRMEGAGIDLTKLSNADLLQKMKEAGVEVPGKKSPQAILQDAKEAGNQIKKPSIANPSDLAAAAKDVENYLHPGPEVEAKGPLEYLTKTIPQSARATGYGLATLPGQLAQTGSDVYTKSKSEGKGILSSLLTGVDAASKELIKGTVDAFANPLGLGGLIKSFETPGAVPSLGGGLDIAKESWYKRPVQSALAVYGAKKSIEGTPASESAVDVLSTPKYISETNKLIRKSIRPNFGQGTTSFAQQTKYLSQTRRGLETIVRNKNGLDIRNEMGEKINLPETLNQAQQAHSQTMENLFRQWDEMAKTAEGKGTKANVDPIVSELQETINDKVLQRSAPQDVAYARIQLKAYSAWKKDGGLSPLEAQRTMRILNERTETWFKNPSPDTVGATAIDARIAHLLRKAQDQAITKTEGPGYQQLRNQYRDLKTFERDLNRRTWVAGRQSPKGFFDLTDVFSGYHAIRSILSKSPQGIVASAGAKGIAAYIKRLNSPDRMIKNLFRKVDSAVQKSSEG